MDRWAQHTKDCPDCLRSLKQLDAASAAAAALGVAALVATLVAAALPGLLLATGGAGAPPAWALPSLAGWWLSTMQLVGLQAVIAPGAAVAAVALGVHVLLTRLRAGFFFEEYVHALKD